MILDEDDPLTVALVDAIHGGDVEELQRLLTEQPDLATATIGDPNSTDPKAMSRTLLHVATDWPGHRPNGVEAVAALVEAGADVNARFTGPHAETPLHWAASSDDVEVLDALVEAGADVEAPGAVIGGGTPLSDAVAFGQWRAAWRLIEHGATTLLWEAAALGLMARVEEAVEGDDPPDANGITEAFWCACHGGQHRAAEYLLDRGADVNWIGYDDLTPLDAAHRSDAAELVDWLRGRGAKSTTELR